jgi:cardiolipin synthase
VEAHARLLERLESLRKRFDDHPNIVRPNLQAETMATVRLAERLGHLPILGGNEAELIEDTDAVIDRLIHDIEHAERHVHLLFYIYADDAVGRRVAEALTRATHRGVKCRVLVDAVGSRPMLRHLAPIMRKRGIEVRSALPVGLLRRSFSRIDVRNHRKIAVIDGRVGYTGSQNIVHAAYGTKDLVWYDLTARLHGPITLALQTVFLEDWYFETDELLDEVGVFPEPINTGEVAVQALPSGPNYPTENYQRLVVAALHSAQKRVIITTPYFVPDESVLQAMETAVLRGADVDVVVPARNNMRLVDAAARAYFDDLLAVGVDIHLFREGLLHAKTISVDNDVAFITSSNFDIRSFRLNFEINLLLYGAEITEKLRQQQYRYIEGSDPVDPAKWRERPPLQRFGQNVAKLMSPLL